MVRAILVLLTICLGVSVADTLHPSWIAPITATSSTVTATPTPTWTLTDSGTTTSTESGTAFSCGQYYRVHDGDTCDSIQDRFMTFTLQQFYSWNPQVFP